MTTEQKLTRAKIKVILNHPFFATIMLSMEFKLVPGVRTAATDGKSAFFDPEFVDNTPELELQGVIAHEVLHVTSLHHTRRNNRDLEKWNYACDYAINPILITAGFKLPGEPCLNKDFKDLTAEEIYKRLPDPPKKPQPNQGQGGGQGTPSPSGQPQPGQGQQPATDPGGCGGVMDAPANSQAEMNKIEAETKQLVVQAARAAQKKQGKLPSNIERLIEEVLTPIVNWHELLAAFLTEVTRNDYTFSRPSTRFIGQGLYLPSLRSVEKGSFVLMVDTSGSIDNVLLNKFAAEMQAILNDCAQSLIVIFIDAAVQSVQEFEADDQINLKPKGGGGTDFRPGFTYMEKKGIEAACVVYFTDGCCNDFPKEPATPVLWATYENKSFKPPFGQVIHVE